MDLRMTKEEREAFLAEVHVAVVSIDEPGRGPLTAPVWYAYEPGGDVLFVTGRESRKGRLLERASRMTVCVQREQPPYGYVVVEGPFTLERPDYAEHRRGIAHRYLGAEAGERYLAANGGEGPMEDEVLVRVKPERWLTADYSKLRF
jgi:PPOX class probable F420-dependent enzyme